MRTRAILRFVYLMTRRKFLKKVILRIEIFYWISSFFVKKVCELSLNFRAIKERERKKGRNFLEDNAKFQMRILFVEDARVHNLIFNIKF